MIWRHMALSMVSAFALTACVSAPVPPEGNLALAASGPFLSAQVGATSDADVPRDWWRLYDSPELDGLVLRALENNRSLAVAEANLAQVRAALRETRAALLPSTTATAGTQYVRDPSFPAADRESGLYSLGFDTAYEVDLFGRVSSSVEAARQDTLAAENAWQAAALMVAGETARAWIDYCAGGIQLETAEANYRLQSETLDLARTLFDAGRSIRLDVVQAEAARRRAEAEIPSVRAARDASMFRLARLTGQLPAEMSKTLPACPRMPRLVSTLPTGDGASLIARRPDVRQAEHQLAGAAARVGIATADLYPSVRLGGVLSTSALHPDQVFSSDSVSFGFGPLISWTFPNTASVRARISGAEAGVDGALAQFDETFLTALEESETALTNYTAERERYAALEAALAASEEAAELARTRYRLGSANFLSVLDAERTLVETRIAVAQSEAAKASAEINVFMALGGGWAGD